MRLWSLRDQFIRFSIMGAIGFVVDVVTLYGVMAAFELNPYAARLVSYSVAATMTWWLNRRYTFVHSIAIPPSRQWVKFLTVNAFGGLVNYATYAALIALDHPQLSVPILAVGVGAVTGLAFNFFGSRTLVFASPKP